MSLSIRYMHLFQQIPWWFVDLLILYIYLILLKINIYSAIISHSVVAEQSNERARAVPCALSFSHSLERSFHLDEDGRRAAEGRGLAGGRKRKEETRECDTRRLTRHASQAKPSLGNETTVNVSSETRPRTTAGRSRGPRARGLRITHYICN